MTNNSLKTYSLGYVTALVVVVFLALLLSGCSAPEHDSKPTEYSKDITYTDISAYGAVRRYVDREAGVVCWFYSDYEKGGASCLPINQTLLDPEEYR